MQVVRRATFAALAIVFGQRGAIIEMEAALALLENLSDGLPCVALVFWFLATNATHPSPFYKAALARVFIPVTIVALVFSFVSFSFGHTGRARARAVCALVTLALLVRLVDPAFYEYWLTRGFRAWLYSPALYGDLWMITEMASVAVNMLIVALQLIVRIRDSHSAPTHMHPQ